MSFDTEDFEDIQPSMPSEKPLQRFKESVSDEAKHRLLELAVGGEESTLFRVNLLDIWVGGQIGRRLTFASTAEWIQHCIEQDICAVTVLFNLDVANIPLSPAQIHQFNREAATIPPTEISKNTQQRLQYIAMATNYALIWHFGRDYFCGLNPDEINKAGFKQNFSGALGRLYRAMLPQDTDSANL